MVSDFAVVEAATTLREAEEKLGTGRFDLVILDIALPDGNGLTLLDRINALQPPPPILVFTANEFRPEHADDVAKVLLKSRTSNREIVDTIRSLIAPRFSRSQ
ncbi:MAG TPA: response regulator [Magnetospirillaceae bacterium]